MLFSAFIALDVEWNESYKVVARAVTERAGIVVGGLEVQSDFEIV